VAPPQAGGMRVSAHINPNSNPRHQTAAMQSESPPGDEACALPKSAEVRIASGLKQLYSEMLAEPMPDKFVTLLDRLSKAQAHPERKP